MGVDVSVGGPDDGKERYEPAQGEAKESKDMLELVGEFDINTGKLEDLFERLSAHPAEVNSAQGAFEILATNVVKSWRAIITKLADEYEPGTEHFTNAVSSMWLKFDHDRVDFFEKITNGQTDYLKAEIEDLRDTVDTVCREENGLDKEGIVTGIVFGFKTGMLGDLDTALSSIKAAEYMSGVNKEKNHDTEDVASIVSNERAASPRLRGFGGHVIDTLKIGLGVAGGIVAGVTIVDQYLRRRR